MSVTVFGQPVGEPVAGWTPRPMPAGRLVGRFVRLEPLGHEHLPGLFDATCGPDDDARWTYLPSGPHRLTTELRDAVDGYRARADAVALAIVVDGVVEGMACYLHVAPDVGVLELGHILYGRRLARTAAATEVVWLMLRQAFDLGYRRVEWKCDSLNDPSRRAAERLGFTYEGRFRKALVTKGRNRDTDWYAMTDDDWRLVAPAYDRWFAGIAPNGRQATQLAARTALHPVGAQRMPPRWTPGREGGSMGAHTGGGHP